MTGARFDAARADLCGFVGSQDRFARLVERLAEVHQDVDQDKVVGTGTE